MTQQEKQSKIICTTLETAKSYNPMIYGGFLEHFDNQIYGGVFDPSSSLSDKDGFRSDVIEALRELKPPVIRWPGGCFVDAYHWEKGVGKREAYGDYRWGVMEPNTFGTHEFVELCKRIGTEAYVCHNGMVDARENIDWVDYCNATEGPLAEMRKANGYAEPLNVRFWSVGNERYDKAYVDRVNDTAKAMKASDSTIQITCSGSQGSGGTSMPPVREYLLKTAAEHLDYISMHNYWLDRANKVPQNSYMDAISKSEMPDAYMDIVIDSLVNGGRENIKIAFDEWNLRAWQHPGFPRDKVDDYESSEVRSLVEQRQQENDNNEQYTMAYALFSASFLNACLRHCEHVEMANIAPIVNTRGPLFVHPKGIVKRPHFHAMVMYRQLLKDKVLVPSISGAKLKHENEVFSAIDSIVTIDEKGDIAIALINRDPIEKNACTIEITGLNIDGQYTATLLTGETENAYNSIENPNCIEPVAIEQEFINGETVLPPHSLTIVQIVK